MYDILHDAPRCLSGEFIFSRLFFNGIRDKQVGHVILLGDSIFDNASYVGAGDPDVVRQVQAELPRGWQATLLAVDGSVIGNVGAQARGLPADASHLVLSVGGNDTLGHAHLLGDPARSMAEALDMLARAADEFEREYQLMLDALLAQHQANLPREGTEGELIELPHCRRD